MHKEGERAGRGGWRHVAYVPAGRRVFNEAAKGTKFMANQSRPQLRKGHAMQAIYLIQPPACRSDIACASSRGV